MGETIENDVKQPLAEENMVETPNEEPLTSPEVQKNEVYDAKMKTINKTLMFSVGILLLIVFVVLGFGFWKDVVQTPRLVVATVDGEEITVKMYQTRARYLRFQLLQETVRLRDVLDTQGDIAGTQQNTLDYLEMMLENPSQIAASTMNSLVEDVILHRKAEEYGIVITEEDIDAAFFDKLAETSVDPTGYTQEQFETDYAAYVDVYASSGLKEKDLREMRHNILIRNGVMIALSEGIITDENTLKTIFDEWLETERLAISELLEVDQELMEEMTPSEPSFNDPKVVEALNPSP